MTTKVDEKVQLCMEQFIRMMHSCGLPREDIDLIYCRGPVMNKVLVDGNSRMTLFTGSQAIAEKLCSDLKGKVRLEDAGFDWKILGPDVDDFDFVAWQSDQDAYACSGQKCSAQSICFMHENWVKAGFVERIADIAAKRKLADLSIGPVLSHSTAEILDHTEKLLKIPGAKLAFGGKELQN